MNSKELFKGTLSTVILKLLAENGKMYGYEITKMVSDLTDGEIELKAGSLYPALHKLERDKLVVVHHENVGKRVRKYYSLTKEGEGNVSIRLDEFASFITTINRILNPKLSNG